jgi:glycine/D-amino acid oxidase-like deaminating enzyme
MALGRADVVVVGAGMIGAACAYELAGAGLDVCVVERGAIASGTTGAGEGNILVSDKLPGPELDLALVSARRWRELGDELDDDFELEIKGGVVCAATEAGLGALRELAARQAAAGVEVTDVTGDRLWELEPALNRELRGGAHYPGDLQVQPMRAAAALLRGARRRGARVLTATEVRGVRRDASGAVAAVATADGEIATPALVNAAGAWSAHVAELAGSWLPIGPRRGVILVTEPLPPTVFHKVYAAEYVGDVGSSAAALQVSTVVEGTVSGTILIGASRELVGFEPQVASDVLRRLAGAAVAMFPTLASVRVMRAYRGYRPFSPDHLPVIGADPTVAGLWHACGHEGAGIGLAPATGQLVAAALTGAPAPVDAEPFAAGRFAEAVA